MDPTRPTVDAFGQLMNPIGRPPFAQLRDEQPIRYEELTPATTYVAAGFQYLTDYNSMPARVRGALRLVPATDRVSHDTTQRAVGQQGAGIEGPFHGGHIIAVSLGGFASGPNLFCQAANSNVGAYARLDQSWRQALREGCTVEIDIGLAEGEDPDTPEFLLVTHWEGGPEETLTFINYGRTL